MAVRITCIDKPSGNLQDPHEAISRYGWTDESTGESKVSTRVQMVDWVKNGGQAYVRDVYGNQVFCNWRKSLNGTEFLQTVTDGKWSDNLLSLPKCGY
jgi:hypothetical protein